MDNTLHSQRGFSEKKGISIPTLERWRQSGEGPPYVRLGRRIYYRESDFDAWAKRRTFRHRADELSRKAG